MSNEVPAGAEPSMNPSLFISPPDHDENVEKVQKVEKYEGAVDICFVLDASSHVSEDEFEKIKTFVNMLIDR